MGHGERPLAEVFSVMPRCAPLRLPQGEASGGPFSRPLPECISRTQKRVAFARGRKLLLFFTEFLALTRPIPPPSTAFARLVQPRHVVPRFRNSYGASAHWRKRIFFRYNLTTHIAPLAQLDRASGYEPEGREFESLRARHLSSYITIVCGSGCVSKFGGQQGTTSSEKPIPTRSATALRNSRSCRSFA